MKKKYCVLVLLILLTGIASAEEDADNVNKVIQNADQISEHSLLKGIKGFIEMFEKIYRLFMHLSLPPALDNIYEGSVPGKLSSTYIFEMFKLADPMTGIGVDVQRDDWANATNNFEQFKDQYIYLSTMVPQWKGYWDIKYVNQLGKDIKNKNKPAVFQDLGKIGQVCSKCHSNQMPQVWAKYYWKDFDTVKVSTPEGDLPFTDAMYKYLDVAGFAAMGVNIREGRQQDALDSFNMFQTMLLNFKQACNECHNTPRYYFVSDDVMANVSKMGDYIQEGKLGDAEIIRQQLGETCIKCHIVHMPAQDMKDKIGK